MKIPITILTVNYKTSDFIDLMLYSFEKLTYNPYKVLICDNYSSDQEIVKLTRITKKYENIEVIFRKQSKSGSVGHAEAMDLLVSKVDTQYFVTMDSDCIFLLKNWDKFLIQKINIKVKLIGTALPKNKVNYKPVDFPLVFAVLYETATFKKINPSFMPSGTVKDKSKDTGWEIREKYLQNGFKGLVFKGINTRFEKNTPYEDILCAVYYLDDLLIASHFGRGSSNGNAKYNNKWWFKIPLLSKLLRKCKGLKEMKKWLLLSKNIIEDEIKC